MSNAVRHFAVIDLETGGLDAASDPIYQVAVVCGDLHPSGTRLANLSTWSSLIRLRRPWDPIGAQHIHGISRRQLLLAPSSFQALNRLFGRIGGREIVAHNLAFDWKFLTAAAQMSDLQLPSGPHLCTLRLSRRLDPDRQRSHRLSDICERYGIDIGRSHDASTTQLRPPKYCRSSCGINLLPSSDPTLELLLPIERRASKTGQPPQPHRRDVTASARTIDEMSRQDEPQPNHLHLERTPHRLDIAHISTGHAEPPKCHPLNFRISKPDARFRHRIWRLVLRLPAHR